MWKHPGSKFFSLIVVDTGDQPLLMNISANFIKIWISLMVYTRALGKLISEKRLKLKISCQTPFLGFIPYYLTFRFHPILLLCSGSIPNFCGRQTSLCTTGMHVVSLLWYLLRRKLNNLSIILCKYFTTVVLWDAC